MWLVASYASTALFSLKLSMATSSGGKSLLAPTPYAIKLALLDAAYRTLGIREAEACWPAVRNLQVAYGPPRFVTVTNLFTRILKPNRSAKAGEPPFGRSIGYREYVQFNEPLRLALEPKEEASCEMLAQLLARVSYLGKRGSFVQLLAPPQRKEELPEGFLLLNAPNGQAQFDARGTLQMLDDCSPDMPVERVNSYSGVSVRAGRDRLSYPIVLPYRVVRASKSYTLYRRLD
jgi:hypothetical protein